MSIVSTLSKIAFTAALGAATASYAAEGGNDNAVGSNSSATNIATTNTLTRVVPTVIHQGTPQCKTGLFTDVCATSRLIEVEETEYPPLKSSPAISVIAQNAETATPSVTSNTQSIISSGFGEAVRKKNVYLETQLCEGNSFYGQCTTTRTKVAGMSRDL